MQVYLSEISHMTDRKKWFKKDALVRGEILFSAGTLMGFLCLKAWAFSKLLWGRKEGCGKKQDKAVQYWLKGEEEPPTYLPQSPFLFYVGRFICWRFCHSVLIGTVLFCLWQKVYEWFDEDVEILSIFESWKRNHDSHLEGESDCVQLHVTGRWRQ